VVLEVSVELAAEVVLTRVVALTKVSTVRAPLNV